MYFRPVPGPHDGESTLTGLRNSLPLTPPCGRIGPATATTGIHLSGRELFNMTQILGGTPCLLAGHVGLVAVASAKPNRKEVPRMATTPRMHSRRDANSPAGVPHSYVPLSDGTHGRHRTGAPALATIGTLKRPLIFLFLALTLLFALTACATADNPSRGERASSLAPRWHCCRTTLPGWKC